MTLKPLHYIYQHNILMFLDRNHVIIKKEEKFGVNKVCFK